MDRDKTGFQPCARCLHFFRVTGCLAWTSGSVAPPASLSLFARVQKALGQLAECKAVGCILRPPIARNIVTSLFIHTLMSVSNHNDNDNLSRVEVVGFLLFLFLPPTPPTHPPSTEARCVLECERGRVCVCGRGREVGPPLAVYKTDRFNACI